MFTLKMLNNTVIDSWMILAFQNQYTGVSLYVYLHLATVLDKDDVELRQLKWIKCILYTYILIQDFLFSNS